MRWTRCTLKGSNDAIDLRDSTNNGVVTGVLILLGSALLVGGFVAHRYKELQTVLSDVDVNYIRLDPIGKLSLGPLHTGASFTFVVNGSYDGYCDSSGPVVTRQALLLSSQNGYALNLTVTVGARSYALLIPMPG